MRRLLPAVGAQLPAFIGLITLTLALSVFSGTIAHATTYEYDNLNRLTRVDFENGNSIDYTYEQAGNRLTETVTGTGGEALPVAQFSATPTSGQAPLAVQFSDESSGSPTLHGCWEFGDGGTSSESSPLHTYMAAGSYTVSLTVTNAVEGDTETKQEPIRFLSLLQSIPQTPLHCTLMSGRERCVTRRWHWALPST